MIERVYDKLTYTVAGTGDRRAVVEVWRVRKRYSAGVRLPDGAYRERGGFADVEAAKLWAVEVVRESEEAE